MTDDELKHAVDMVAEAIIRHTETESLLRAEIKRLRADKERLIADYNDQQRIIAEANNLATDLMLERDRLRAQLAVAVEALEFYATFYNYGARLTDDGKWMPVPVHKDGGEKARAALARIKEGKP